MILNGKELAEYIKERQAKDVRRFFHSNGRAPRLLILRDSDDPVIRKYVDLKKEYGEDIGVEVVDRKVATSEVSAEILVANADPGIDGMIVQLPLSDVSVSETDEVLAKIDISKDVDGLNPVPGQKFFSATAEAIHLLLAGYNVDLREKKIAIVGHGRLVGKPLAEMWRKSGLDVTVFRSGDAEKMPSLLPEFDIIVVAVGKPGLITSEMLKPKAVVVDAGTASEDNAIVGDVAENVRERSDISITPKIGGVGPMTIASLFENLLKTRSK